MFDICYPLHGLNGLHVEVTVVLEGLISFFFELVDCILSELFVVKFAIGFGPGKFAWVVFGFEVTMTFRPAEAEGFAVVSDEHDAMSRVDWSRAEVAPFDSHQQSIIIAGIHPIYTS